MGNRGIGKQSKNLTPQKGLNLMNQRKQVRSFEDLMVWQISIELVKQVYLLTATGGLSKDFGLRDQIRRASVSVPTNIAEGFERGSRKEYLQFLNFAKGSAGEVRSLLRVALEVGYLEVSVYEELKNAAAKLSAYLYNQMKALRNVRG
jgi:four helix bundle protein